MIFIKIILALCLLFLTLPVLVFLFQITAAVLMLKKVEHKNNVESNPKNPKIAVLMPAHNEQLVIEKTIQSIMPQLSSKDSLFVVADNCTDETSTIASSLGANVLVRENKTLQGKSYALDYGIQSIKHFSPDVVIIVDADCLLSEGAIQKLVDACLFYSRPVQALYLMEMPKNPSIKARIAQLAWIVKNKVRPTGFKSINLPCQLMGTGMAFLWEDLIHVNLASGHIAEDMKLGSDLAKVHKAPIFLPEAVVTSIFPETKEAIITQRTRWEHGHLSVMFTESPSLLFEAIRNRNMQAFGLFLDLIVPPLALLVLMTLGVLVTSLLLSIFMSIIGFVIWALILLCLISSSVMLAWLYFGRNVISLKQLCFAPIYALEKVSLYFKFIVNRQVEWVRSKRD